MSRTLFTFFRMYYDKQVVIDYYNEVGLTLLPEFTFSNEHGYRFDFFHSPSGCAIEVMGGVWLGSRGGHTSGAGYLRDMAKENLALSLGYRVFKCVPSEICMDDTRELFARIVEVASAQTGAHSKNNIKRSGISSRGSDPIDGKKPEGRSKRGRSGAMYNRSGLPKENN